MVVAVIMAGGKGERFWPQSRRSRPKQFLDITGRGSLLQETVSRIGPIVPPERVWVVTTAAYRDSIAQQLPEVPPANIVVEPVGRNTAACLGLAALYLEPYGPDTVMVVLPSDHLIQNRDLFVETLKVAIEAAHGGEVVTLGIRPTRPETGYGYINYEEAALDSRLAPRRVRRFVEKPDRATAERYLAEGSYLWNSGMFVWKLSTFQDLVRRHMPALHRCLEVMRSAIGTPEEEAVIAREYEALDGVSVDYGIMEKAEKVLVIPAPFDWDDVGSWLALDRLGPADEAGNVVRGDFVGVDTSRCIVQGYDNRRLIATVGLSDLIIVDTEDVILVCPKDKAQEVRALVEELKRRGLDRYL